MNLEFKDKYLKYKKKYLELKDLMAGGKSKLTPEQERANAFYKVMNFYELIKNKEKILFKGQEYSKIIKTGEKYELSILRWIKKALEIEEKKLAEFKKILENEIDTEIAKEKKKTFKTGARLKELEMAREDFINFAIKTQEDIIMKTLKEFLEHAKKMELEINNVINAKKKIYENLNQNLEKYFKIDKKNRINIVKIKEIKSLFDIILSFNESLAKYNNLNFNQPEAPKLSRKYKNESFNISKDTIKILEDDYVSLVTIPGLDWRKPENLIAFKDDYLNKESKKYIDSDITYDRKILEGNEAFLHPNGYDGYLLKFAEGSIFPEGRMHASQTPKNVPQEFEKISLGDVKIKDQHGSQATLTVHFLIPIVMPETCPWDVPYCTDVLAAANKMYPKNQVEVTRKNNNLAEETKKAYKDLGVSIPFQEGGFDWAECPESMNLIECDNYQLKEKREREKFEVEIFKRSVTDLRFISDKTMKKLIQEKLKDPKLTENQKKLLDRPYVRSKFDGKFDGETQYNPTSYKEV